MLCLQDQQGSQVNKRFQELYLPAPLLNTSAQVGFRVVLPAETLVGVDFLQNPIESLVQKCPPTMCWSPQEEESDQMQTHMVICA